MSKPCDFSSLGTSLEVIRELSCDPSQFTLIPDPSESAVSKSSSFHGHVWKGMSGFLDDILFPGIDHCLPCILHSHRGKNGRLLRTLNNIREEFRKALSEIQQADTQYRSSLLRINIPESSMKQFRKNVLRIADCLSVLFSGKGYDLKLYIEPLQQQFNALGSSRLVEKEVEMEDIAHFERSHAMAAIEGILCREFPVQSFVKLVEPRSPEAGEGNKLDALEIKALTEWIAAVQEKKTWLTVGLLHMALWGVLETILNSRSGSPTVFAQKLFTFELQLYRRGCYIFDDDDPHYLAWVADLQLGKTTIEIENQKRSLGTEREIPEFTALKCTLFEIQEDKSKLVMFGRNQVQVGLWMAACAERASALPPIERHIEGPYGHFCVVGDVRYSLKDLLWHSRADKVDTKDMPILDQIIVFLDWMGQQERLPRSLDINKFFVVYKADKELLRAFPFLEQYPNLKEEKYKRHRMLNKLEVFARECSKENKAIFRYLMHKSHLLDHPLARFYRDKLTPMIFSLQWQLSIRDEIHLLGMSDSVVIEHAEQFLLKLQEVANLIFAHLQPKLKNQSQAIQNKLKQIIATTIMDFQKEMGHCSTLCSTLCNEIGIGVLEERIVKNNDWF